MENRLQGGQHFYIIMLHGYNTKLPLSKAFCQKLNGEHSEVATITSCKGTWEVKIEKGSCELISFGRGWDVFAREHDLSLGTLILFQNCGKMHFTAKMFDLTACGKEFLVNSTIKIDRTTGEEPANTNTFDSSHFTTVITSRDVRLRFRCLYIPMAFTRVLVKRKSVILRYSNGEEWTVKAVRYTRNRLVMTKGWADFCVAKQLKIGDSCTFRIRESPDRCKFHLLDVCINRV